MVNEELVSIIIPAYNVEKYIYETLDSVKKQTYKKWECIIVDDCSSDKTSSIIHEFEKEDSRFRYIRLSQNSGAAIARNTAVENANGKYLAFLDSDDIWKPQKLEKQIHFMQEHGYSFTCTTYGKMNAQSEVLKKVIKARTIYDYDRILKDCPGNSTIIYDCEVLGKIYGENIRRRNDFVMWLKTIKVAQYAYGLEELLSYHRVRENSISSNKFYLIKYQWMVYRKIEKKSIVCSFKLIVYKLLQGLIRILKK